MATQMTGRAVARGSIATTSRAAPAPVSRRAGVVARSTGWADPSATTAEKAMFGENFGARDPFAAEIESNFGDKVLGHYNTDHIIKVPTKIKDHVGLSAWDLVPEQELALLEEKDLNLLKQQVPGWKVVAGANGQQAIRYDWRLKSPDAAAALQGMIAALPVAAAHAPAFTVSGEMLAVELTTASVGGLSVNDFVVAAKINELDIKELVPPPRKRFWA